MKKVREVKCNLRLYDKDCLAPIPASMKPSLFLIGSHPAGRKDVIVFEVDEKEYTVSVFELERALLKIRLDGGKYEEDNN